MAVVRSLRQGPPRFLRLTVPGLRGILRPVGQVHRRAARTFTRSEWNSILMQTLTEKAAMRRALATNGIVLMAALVTASAEAQGTPAIDLAEAREVLAAARALDRPELTALWETPVACPLILADPRSRQAVASHADSGGVLRPVDGAFVATLPEAVGIANYGLDWGGRRWTMVMWPLPTRARERDRLLAHEMFHCLQPRLGMPAESPLNAHLDEEEGRLWLRMEWRALEEALLRQDGARRIALEDALRFRRHRRGLFATAEAQERALEWNEGLAEYTGLRGSGYPAHVLADRAAVDLASWERRASFSRAFAYASGPAYGILLDESGTAWRDAARQGGDLGDLAARAYQIPDRGATTAAELDRRGERYDLPRVRREERARAERAAATLADLTRRFVDGPVVRLTPGEQFSFSFDPTAVQNFREGTVHRTLRISDVWGVLEVTANGVWLPRTEGRITAVVLPAPAGSEAPVKGDGWELRLAEGWRVVPGSRAGDWEVVRR